MRKLFLQDKWTATLAVGGILSLIAGIYFFAVAIFHMEPYLSSDEKGIAFLYYGGDYAILLLALFIVLMGTARYRTE